MMDTIEEMTDLQRQVVDRLVDNMIAVSVDLILAMSIFAAAKDDVRGGTFDGTTRDLIDSLEVGFFLAEKKVQDLLSQPESAALLPVLQEKQRMMVEAINTSLNGK